VLSVAALGYEVSPVVPDVLPWLVRVWLRSARRKARTGLLLYGIIRQGPIQISSQMPYASIREGKRHLGMRGPSNRLPKWVSLTPGAHELSFQAGNSIRFSSFEARMSLNEGDVLVALCEPVQRSKSPKADMWKLGIIDSAGRVRAEIR
jgi:hypothetical protein